MSKHCAILSLLLFGYINPGQMRSENWLFSLKLQWPLITPEERGTKTPKVTSFSLSLVFKISWWAFILIPSFKLFPFSHVSDSTLTQDEIPNSHAFPLLTTSQFPRKMWRWFMVLFHLHLISGRTFSYSAHLDLGNC